MGVICGRSALPIGWPFMARLAGVFTAAGTLPLALQLAPAAADTAALFFGGACLRGWMAGIAGRHMLLAFTTGTKKPAQWPAIGWGGGLLAGDHYDNGQPKKKRIRYHRTNGRADPGIGGFFLSDHLQLPFDCVDGVQYIGIKP